MKYTVEVNEKSVVVTLDGYKGVAKCCEGDTFNLQTGIELALERAKVAKATAEKPKSAPTVAEAIKVLEDYVGDHIAIIGKGVSLSDNQKRELREYADRLAPIDEYEEWDEDEDEDEIVEDELEQVSELAARMIKRIREILGE